MENLYIDEIKKAFNLEDEKLMKQQILAFHPYEVSETLLELSKEERKRIYKHFTGAEISNIISFLDEEDILKLFDEMTPKYIIGIIQEFDIDDAVEIMQALPDSATPVYLKLMDESHQNKIKEFLKYEDDTAGSIMNTEFIEIQETDTVEIAMKKLIDQAVDAESINILYVIDDDDCLQGTLSLREMILARKGQIIKDIMNTRIISVNTSMDQENVADIFVDYDFTSLPVVDSLNRMLGIITIDDIVDIIEEEASEDYSRLAAISNAEIHADTETVWMSAKKRLPWLLILSLLGFLTSTLIAQYTDVLATIPTIALFMPMILGMGGNSGTQSLAVTVRGLNDGEFDNKKSIIKHLLREAGTGLLNGFLLAIILFGIIFIFLLIMNNIYALKIAKVVSLSIFVGLTVSTLMGALMPIIMNSFKIDPAIASGPFVSVINDLLGIGIYFTLAILLVINTL